MYWCIPQRRQCCKKTAAHCVKICKLILRTAVFAVPSHRWKVEGAARARSVFAKRSARFRKTKGAFLQNTEKAAPDATKTTSELTYYQPLKGTLDTRADGCNGTQRHEDTKGIAHNDRKKLCASVPLWWITGSLLTTETRRHRGLVTRA